MKYLLCCIRITSYVQTTYLQLLLVRLHLLKLVSDGLHVPGSVVSFQVVKLRIAETLLQLLKGVTKLNNNTLENQSPDFISWLCIKKTMFKHHTSHGKYVSMDVSMEAFHRNSNRSVQIYIK